MIADATWGPGSEVGRVDQARLLVADPSDESRVRLAEYFRGRGYEVLEVADGIEAIARAVTHRVDVVVMSATLPGLEGYEAAAIVRRLRPGARIVLTTGTDLDTRPHTSERREVFRCFPAPLDLESIARALEAEPGDPHTLTDRTREDAR